MMSTHVYKVIEVVGSSPVSFDEAVRNGIERAARRVRHIGWFEVIEHRGHVADGRIAHYQATMKIGFSLDDGD